MLPFWMGGPGVTSALRRASGQCRIAISMQYYLVALALVIHITIVIALATRAFFERHEYSILRFGTRRRTISFLDTAT